MTLLQGGAIPEIQSFEGDSAFKFLGLSKTQGLYGFIGWRVAHPPNTPVCAAHSGGDHHHRILGLYIVYILVYPSRKGRCHEGDWAWAIQARQVPREYPPSTRLLLHSVLSYTRRVFICIYVPQHHRPERPVWRLRRYQPMQLLQT